MPDTAYHTRIPRTYTVEASSSVTKIRDGFMRFGVTSTMKALTSVSLFSGCLGLDLGLEKAGIHSALYVEKDPAARASIHLNRPSAICLEDICTLYGKDILDMVSKPIDVVVGGPPCQSFSTIGTHGSTGDERGRMIFEYRRVVAEVRPTFFIMENVRGLAVAKHNNRPFLPYLLNSFRSLGYNVGAWLLNASDFGVPQHRRRLILVGSKHGVVPEPQPTAEHPVPLGAVIRDLEDDTGECGSFSPRMQQVLKKIPEGGNWKSLDRRTKDIAMGGADRASGGLTGFYRRLSYARPSPTLMTSPIQRSSTLCHPTQTRPLSIAEYKRIQGFPDDWALSGSTSQKYRQLGNAVPVKLAAAIAGAIREAA